MNGETLTILVCMNGFLTVARQLTSVCTYTYGQIDIYVGTVCACVCVPDKISRVSEQTYLKSVCLRIDNHQHVCVNKYTNTRLNKRGETDA